MRRCGGRFEQGRDGIDGNGTTDERTQGVGVEFGEALTQVVINLTETRFQDLDQRFDQRLHATAVHALPQSLLNALLDPLLNPFFDPAFDPFLSNGHV